MIRPIALVAGGTLLSRLLGFLRDALFAALLGAGAAAEAFVFAFQLVNVARRLLTEGALNAALIPAWRRVRDTNGDAAAADFAGAAVATIGLSLALAAALIGVAMPLIVAALAPGFAGAPAFAAAVADARLMLPYLAFAGPAAVMLGLANAERRFGLTALAPALFNVLLIAAIAALLLAQSAPERAGSIVAAAVGVAGVAQLAILWRRSGQIGPLRPSWSPELRALLSRAMPAMVVHGAPQLLLIAAATIASATPSAVAWLYFAARLIELPLGLIGIAAGTVLTAELSHQGDAGAHRAALTQGVTLALAVALPAAAGLIALATPIVTLLFQHGAFTAADAAGTAQALAALALALPAHALAKALAPAALAQRPVAPMLAALAGAALAFTAALALQSWGATGVAAGLAAGAWLFALGLARLTPELRLDAPRLLRILVAALGMALALWPLAALLPLAPKPAAAAALSGAILFGVALYVALLIALGVTKPADLARALRR